MFEQHLLQTRRQFFEGAGLRLGGAALAMLAGQTAMPRAANAATATGSVHPALPGLPHHPPKAKAMIYFHMNGGPSQLDSWDYKPGLQEYFDKDLPPSVQGGQRLSTMTSGQSRFPVAPSKFKFEQRGNAGIWVNTDLLPHTANIVDEITLVKTVNTNAINHDPACTFVFTGSEIPGKASMGSWLAYGLGSENNDLFSPNPIHTDTNRHGGMLGGISSGMPIVCRVAIKPTSSIPRSQKTVTTAGEPTEILVRGRHDPCLLPRFVPMGEAMMALVLVDHLLRAKCSKLN